jgi:hypothetical protein
MSCSFCNEFLCVYKNTRHSNLISRTPQSSCQSSILQNHDSVSHFVFYTLHSCSLVVFWHATENQADMVTNNVLITLLCTQQNWAFDTACRFATMYGCHQQRNMHAESYWNPKPFIFNAVLNSIGTDQGT